MRMPFILGKGWGVENSDSFKEGRLYLHVYNFKGLNQKGEVRLHFGFLK